MSVNAINGDFRDSVERLFDAGRMLGFSESQLVGIDLDAVTLAAKISEAIYGR